MEITHESLIGTFEQKQELVSQFNLIHDDFFAVVMQNKPALETTLRTLLKKKDLLVTEVRIQYSIRNLVSHSVILDVLAEDSTGKLYNIEVQVKNEDDYQKRSRYNQANISIPLSCGRVRTIVNYQRSISSLSLRLTSLERMMFVMKWKEFLKAMVK